MQLTPFICHFVTTNHDIQKAIEEMGQHLDSQPPNFQLAGVCLGRVKTLGEQLSRTARLAEDALWRDST